MATQSNDITPLQEAAAAPAEDANRPVVPPRKSRSSRELQHLAIADMNCTDRHFLCDKLSRSWDTLAVHMQLDKADIVNVEHAAKKFNMTTAEALLSFWGDRMNHNVTELFVLLARNGDQEAMLAIRHLVDSMYHRLIKAPTTNRTGEANNNSTDGKTGSTFNRRIQWY